MVDIPNLKEVTFELTTKCGANCIMCARNKYSRPGLEMDIRDAELYVDKVVDSGYNAIILGGMGDPLCYSHLEEFFEYVKNKHTGLSIRLTTTGQLMDAHNWDLVCKYVDILKISNYGFTKKTYEAVHRGNLVFEKVQNNLNQLSHKREKKPYIIMSYLDMQENHAEVREWIRYWSRKGLHEVNVWKQHNWGGYVAEREVLSDTEIPCERIKNMHFKIWVDGNVSPCVFDCERSLSLGNLRTDSFDLINRAYELLKEIHAKGAVDKTNLICAKCDQIFSRKDALLYLCENGEVIREYR